MSRSKEEMKETVREDSNTSILEEMKEQMNFVRNFNLSSKIIGFMHWKKFL